MAYYKNYYNNIDLKNRDTLRELLYARALFESIGYTSSEPIYSQRDPYENVYHDIMTVYMELDELIDMCDLTKKNKSLLNLVMSGCTLADIYNNFENYNRNNVKEMFRRILIIMSEKQKEIEGGVKDEIDTPQWDRKRIT